jgi:hypothetical protein
LNFPSALRALNAQNFRRYYIGQTVSLLGSWMQSVATMWLRKSANTLLGLNKSTRACKRSWRSLANAQIQTTAAYGAVHRPNSVIPSNVEGSASVATTADSSTPRSRGCALFGMTNILELL